ncbi:glutamate-rich protein 3 [Polyodon spathula]|uniref:glutamate-rich protein 3 n=1 Tax=Polyodon spathula TaxID=7913 RepID=UPI001B7E4340|nr:glutamate-rich protein 3 [Polyodon spathula]
MSLPNPGTLAAYNSLTDRHLTGYFSNTKIRRHLQKVGLITRHGRIVPDKEYRHNIMRRDHQKYVRECLAQAIFHKVLDMERHNQIEIKRKLEDFERKERVQRIKVDRAKRYNEDVVPLLSPRPPTAPKNGNACQSGPEASQSETSEPNSTSPRPCTAPGKIQRPVLLQPIQSNGTAASARRTYPGSRQKGHSEKTEHHLIYSLDREARRHITSTDFASGISPYRLPVINNYVTPVPPPTQKRDITFKGTSNGMRRGRKLRPTTAPNGIEETKDSAKFHKTSVHSNVAVTMVYFGKSVHLSHDDTDFRDEVKVYQQHCGGQNLCVYKGKLLEGETFQFVSRRHHSFPFSLTFFLNTMQVDRLSSCCEFKHRKGARLGGKHGHFGIASVEGASPCYRCIIAVGLDKKPNPPPKKIKKEVEKEESTRDQGKEDKSCSEEEMPKEESILNSSLRSPHREEDIEEENQMELEPKEENEIPEVNHDGKFFLPCFCYKYDDDFEADEARPDAKEENKKEADMNGRSSTPSDDERGNSDTEETDYKEKQKHHSGIEDDRASYSDSEAEDSKQGGRRARSSDSSSSSYSSSCSRKYSESDSEGAKDDVKKEEIKATSSSVSNTEPRSECEAANDVEDQVKNEEAVSDNDKEQHTHEEAKQSEGAENIEISDQVSAEYQQTGEVQRESAVLPVSERNEAVEQPDSMEQPGSAKDEHGITDSKPEVQTETAVFAEAEKQGNSKYAGSSELSCDSCM